MRATKAPRGHPRWFGERPSGPTSAPPMANQRPVAVISAVSPLFNQTQVGVPPHALTPTVTGPVPGQPAAAGGITPVGAGGASGGADGGATGGVAEGAAPASGHLTAGPSMEGPHGGAEAAPSRPGGSGNEGAVAPGAVAAAGPSVARNEAGSHPSSAPSRASHPAVPRRQKDERENEHEAEPGVIIWPPSKDPGSPGHPRRSTPPPLNCSHLQRSVRANPAVRADLPALPPAHLPARQRVALAVGVWPGPLFCDVFAGAGAAPASGIRIPATTFFGFTYFFANACSRAEVSRLT